MKLNGKNKLLINSNKQNELLEIVKKIYLEKKELCSLSEVEKYLILD